jgi:LPS-assembly protein
MGSLWSEEEPQVQAPIEITADGDNRIVGDIAMAELNVVIHYGDDILYADKVSLDRKTKVVMASGNVRIYTKGKVYRGETLIYNFETQKIESSGFRMTDLPVFVGGSKITTPEANHYSLKEGYFTTENREDPGFHFKASTVEIYNNQDVVLKNVVLYVGKIPVLWVPVFVQSLDDDRANFVFNGGVNSRWGAFGKATYNMYFDKNLKGALHFDARQKRGLAGGVDLLYKSKKGSEALFKGYWAEDNDPDANFSGAPRASTSSTRYRFQYEQRTDFKDGLSLMTHQELWSDAHVTEDFFENEYRQDRQPDSFGEAMQYNENFTISLFVRDRLNGFFDTTERLPELKVESKRIKLYDHLEYQSEYSVANLKLQRSSLNTPQGQEYSSYRWDTLQQLLYPRQYFNWLSVTPRLGFRGTAWSDDNRLTPGDKQKDAFERFWGFFGTEASFKASKTWLDVKNASLGIDGIRHVAEPFVNMQIAPSSGVDPDRYRGFDDRLPSHRLQPINPDQYNSIDSLDKQAVVRHGVRNKIQTKRDGVNWDLADWALYADLDMARQKDIDALGSTRDNLYSNIYSDLKVTPLPWLTYESFSSLDVNGNSFGLSDNSVTWQATRSWETKGGIRILKESTLYPDSNLLYWSNFYRLNEHWQFENMLSFEADDGRIEEQSFRIYRDLSSWQLALTIADRDNRGGQDEKLVYFTLTLKAFPSQKLSLDAQ